MQSIKIICIGKLKDAFFREAADEYQKRLKAYGKVEILELPAAFLPENPSESLIQAALEKEAEAFLKKIPPDGLVIAMCIEGKLVSSEELAACMREASLRGSGGIVFLIGGSYGLSERVKNRADMRLSVSRMTFPHRLFRVMLLEQIYRGCKINAKEKYHK